MRPCLRRRPAMLFVSCATSGCAGPSTRSRMERARAYSSQAASVFPCADSSPARLFSDVAT
eukprot:1194500-Prorocentrum_minimum.AAC.4